MKRILASELLDHENKTVVLRGWMNSFRSLGKLGFLILRDRSGLSQIVVEDKEMSKQLSALFPGSILRVEGKVSKSEKAELGVEVRDPKIEIALIPEEDFVGKIGITNNVMYRAGKQRIERVHIVVRIRDENNIYRTGS